MSTPAVSFYLASDGTTIRKVTPSGGISTLTLTSSDALYTANGGFEGIIGLALDGLGNLYAADNSGHAVYKITAAGVVTHLAGVHHVSSETGIGGLAINAGLAGPGAAITLDTAGNIYFADSANVLVINTQATAQILFGVNVAAGCIASIAGHAGTFTYTGDGGLAINATLQANGYGGLAFDPLGNVFIADAGNNVIRRIDHATFIITTAVGNGLNGSTGDGGPPTGAKLGNPGGLSFDAAGNLYFCDEFNYKIRVVNLSGSPQVIWGVTVAPGTIQTVAGTGVQGWSGDGGQASAAKLNAVLTSGFDAYGNFYIGDNLRVRMVTPAGIISTVAGTGVNGNTGDSGLAINAEISFVEGFSSSPSLLPGSGLKERSFACNGCFESSSAYGDVLKSLALSMAGFVVPPGDCWRVYAGSYVPPEITLQDGDCRGSIKGDFRLSSRDTCNGVKGQYIPAFLPINPLGPLASSPASPAWKKTDFPPVQRANYIAEDGGVILWKDIQLDFTISLWMTQRIARIVLERLRRQVTISLPAKLSGLAALAADTLNFLHQRWNAVTPPVPTVFQISHTALRMESQADGVPAFGVDLMLRQIDAAVYEFAPPTSPTSFGDYSPYGQTGIGAGNVE